MRNFDAKLVSERVDEFNTKFRDCVEEYLGGVEEADGSVDDEFADLVRTIDDIDRRVYEHAKTHDELSNFVRIEVGAMQNFQVYIEESYPKVT